MNHRNLLILGMAPYDAQGVKDLEDAFACVAHTIHHLNHGRKVKARALPEPIRKAIHSLPTAEDCSDEQ